MSNLSSYQYTHVPVPNDSTTSSSSGNGNGGGRGGRPYPSVSFSEEDDDENEHGGHQNFFSSYQPNRQSVPHVLGRRQPYLIAGVVFLFLILVTHQGGRHNKDDSPAVPSGDDVDIEPITTTNADDDGTAAAVAATTTTTKTSEAEDTEVVEEDDASAEEEEDGDVQAAADNNHSNKEKENQTDITTTFATYTEDPNLNVPYPRLSLLFGYPQSGLSYTVSAIQSFSSSSGGGANHNPTASGTTATNYGTNANLDDFGRNYLVYDDSPSGPYWLHEPQQPTTTSQKGKRGDNRKYVVTETRCGGHCTYCPPSSYLLKYDDFDTECRTTTHYDENNPDTIVQSVYNDTRIARALHLIRDPLSNVVSRFHSEHLHRKNRHDNTWLAKFPNNKNGFQSWCSEVNGMYGSQDRVNYFSGETLKAMDKVPCVDEFVRYGKWHSYVIEFIQKHKLPSLVLRYDHLGDDATKGEIWSDLVTFLNLPKNKEKVNTLNQFHGGKVYGKTHYTEEQRTSIWKLLKLVMNTKGWELIQPYQE